jgi:KDO2-lipid IV(A) lauroyltransferase
MDLPLYYLARAFMAFIQAFPVTWVARFGRACGALVYLCDARHRRVAERNMTMCLGSEKTAQEIKALARENFRRIGENFACAVKTASMSSQTIQKHIEIVGAEKVSKAGVKPGSRIFAIGHFGNFELFARAVQAIPGCRGATTYRALRGKALNRVLLELRQNSGCLFFERRTEGAALRAALRSEPLILGLLADQHSGDHGLRLPFLGHECTTSKAPAVFALRFNVPLQTAICFRTALGQWRIEVGDEIPTHAQGLPRPLADIMLDVNRALEVAVRRDPANWFWVHNRWKPAKKKIATTEPKPDEEDFESGGQTTPTTEAIETPKKL